MKKIMALASMFLVSLIFASKTDASNLDVCIEVAKKEHKNVLVIFTLDNCKYCDILKQDLANIKYVDNYVVCVINSRDNKRLTGKMGIKKWPTSVVIAVSEENQGEASRIVGYGNKLEYEKWLKLNASFFGEDNACGCNCSEDCRCRKNGECTCCGDKCDCCQCGCGKDCACKKDGKCVCEKGKCKCKITK